MKYKVQRPIQVRIGRGAATEKLYKLEERRNQMITECAKEWGRVINDDGLMKIDVDKELYSRLCAQAMFDILNHFQGGKEAATAYLEKYGYTVTPPAKEPDDG